MNTEQVGVLLVSTLNSTSTEIIKTISNPNLGTYVRKLHVRILFLSVAHIRRTQGKVILT